MIRTRLRKTIEQEPPQTLCAEGVWRAASPGYIAEAEAMFDHPPQQYALFKSVRGTAGGPCDAWRSEALSGEPMPRLTFGHQAVLVRQDG